MKKEFPGYFTGASADIEKIWDECFFVLDANVLLNLYRYSDSTCSELFGVFRGLGDRLWVPHQVVYEYLNNRLPVIGDQSKVYDDAVKKVDSLKKSLESHNQHPFVAADILAESVSVFDKLVAELEQNKKNYEKRINSDEVKDQLEALLEGKVGGGFSRERLDQIIVEGKGRYEQKIPPGYCDAKKGGDSIVFADICRPYGDYIVWLQIIDQARALEKPVVFVTGDTKDDWWASFQGKTLGPHPQLVQEFLELVGKEFYIYTPDRFLERASENLEQVASMQAVNEIREVREVNVDAALLDTALIVNSPVLNKIFHQKYEGWSDRQLYRQKLRSVRSKLEALRLENRALSNLQKHLGDAGLGADAPTFKETLARVAEVDLEIKSLEYDLYYLKTLVRDLGPDKADAVVRLEDL